MSDLSAPLSLTRPLPASPASGLGPSAAADRAERTAVEFEAAFLSRMLQPMFAGLSTEAPFGGGSGEETWRSFLVDAMARRVAEGGGVGLADHVRRELLSLQSVAPSVTEAP